MTGASSVRARTHKIFIMIMETLGMAVQTYLCSISKSKISLQAEVKTWQPWLTLAA